MSKPGRGMEKKRGRSVGVLVKCYHRLFNSDSMFLYPSISGRTLGLRRSSMCQRLFKLLVIAGQEYVVGGYSDFSNFCGL